MARRIKNKLCGSPSLKGCGVEFPYTEEYFAKASKNKLKPVCKDCWKAINAGKQRTRDKIKENARRREHRLLNPEKAFLADSVKSDRRRGHRNNLTIEFIKRQFSLPCSYCGTNSVQKSLDRIDNSKGHTTDNVVACCIRCNYIRRDIPYEAWLVISKSVKECVEKGLLDSYTTFARWGAKAP
jgi:hypothetical protein